MENDEYRERLILKLDALVGVLVVAMGKIESSVAKLEARMDSSDDTEIGRLAQIHKNLKTTLEICQKARRTLLSHQDGKKTPRTAKVKPGAREYIEMSSAEEFRKFKNLPPIQKEDIPLVDLMDLCDRLQQ